MRARGFTLIELMSALLILSLLALMSFRGLGAVLEAREQVGAQTAKWRSVAAFFARFQHDLQLSVPRPALATAASLEFERFASAEGRDAQRRVGYRMNGKQEIELLLWPAAGGAPERYPALRAVAQFELAYLDDKLAWVEAWPRTERDAPLPKAVRVRIVLASGEDLVRVFAVQ